MKDAKREQYHPLFKDIRGSGAQVTRDLLRKLFKRIVIRATQYFDETKEHVFAYRERQLHSVVCPSIADITPSFLIEHPLQRKPTGEPEYRGNVDYWILYRDYSFLMELKHVYFKVNNPSIYITKKFLRALEQLNNIRKNECRNLTIGYGLRKIAFEAVVFYKSSKEKDGLLMDVEKRDFNSMLAKIIENTDLKKKLNFKALWVLDKRLIKPDEYVNKFRIFPAVAFIGYVSEILV